MNETKKFVELNNEELQRVDGGIAWGVIALGVACAAAFGIGVFNGYKGNA